MTPDDLKHSTVRLADGTRALGTGFFVGPGLIATCAHVVRQLEHVDVTYGGSHLAGSVLLREVGDCVPDNPFPDVALISVDQPGGMPVELDERYNPNDDLFIWGYPTVAPDGSAAKGCCEGDHNFGPLPAQSLLKFSLTEIVKGLSGAPVLNLQTGLVCGMVKRTRARCSPAGGYAVRAATLLALPEVESAQRRLDTPLKKALRSHLTSILDAESTDLPKYFPPRLKDRFDQIRQPVRVVTERDVFHRIAEDLERQRARGEWVYDPKRARPEDGALPDYWHDKGFADTRIQVFDWDQIREDPAYRRVAVLGDPGFGKSWLLRYEFRKHARECLTALADSYPRDLLVPVYTKLADLASEAFNTQDFVTTLSLALETRGTDPALRRFLTEQIRTGRAVLLLDAWDEVNGDQDRRRLQGQITVFARQYDGMIVLTSRQSRYDPSILGEAPVIELLAFERAEITAFAESWFDQPQQASEFLQELDRHSSVNGLARIPLMLSLLCRIFESPEMTLPVRRVHLYDRCLKGLLLEWKLKDKGADPDHTNELTVEQSVSEVARAAYALYPASQFTRLDLARSLELPREQTNRFINTLVRDGILIPVGSSSDSPLTFLHRTFHEFLAAYHWANEPWDQQTFDDRSWDSVWHPVIVLLAGLSKPAIRTNVINSLAEAETDDLFRPRLALAILCMREVPAQQMHGVREAVSAEALKVWMQYAGQNTETGLVGLSEAISGLTNLGPAAGEVLQAAAPDLVLRFVVTTRLAAPEVLTGLLRLGLDPDPTTRGRVGYAVEMLGGKVCTPEVLELLVKLSRDPVPWVRRGAVAGLRSLEETTAAPVVLERLLDLSRDPDLGVKWHAARALSVPEKQGPTREVLDRFLELSRNTDDPMMEVAIDALGKLGGSEHWPEIMGRLLELTRDHNTKIRPMVAGALVSVGGMGPTRELPGQLLHMILDPDREVREKATDALGNLGGSDATNGVVRRLADLSLHSDPEVARKAAEALGKLGQIAATPEVLEHLVLSMRDPRPYVGWAAEHALAQLGEKAATPEVIGRLLELSLDADTRARTSAALALGNLGGAAAMPEVLDRLVELSRNREASVRVAAASAIEGLGEKAGTPEVVERLVELSFELDPSIKAAAAGALGAVGQRADVPIVIGRLFELSRDKEAWVRASAIQGLGHKAATQEVVAHLVELTHDPEPWVRWNAASAIGGLGSSIGTPAVLSRLTELVHDPQSEVRSSAALALGLLLDGTSVTPELVDRFAALLHDPDSEIREIARHNLRALANKAATPAAIERLLQHCAYLDPHSKWIAVAAVGRLEATAVTPDLLGRLVEMVCDQDSTVRMGAARALGRTGRSEVLPSLAKLLNHRAGDVRAAAAMALGLLQRGIPGLRLREYSIR